MEGNRLTPVKTKKPRLVLDKRFSFMHDLELGEKGSIDAVLVVENIETKIDPNGNAFRVVTVGVENAEKLQEAGVRV